MLRFTSGGWYTYYIFKQMSEHSLTYGNFSWFWTALLTATGLAAGAALIGARRVPLELLAACAALAVEGYATLVHSGGSINDMLPAYLAMALLAGLALGSGPARWAATASGALVLAQIRLPARQRPPVPGGPRQRHPRRRRTAGRGHAGVRRRRRGPRGPRPEPAGGNGPGRGSRRGFRRRAGHRPHRDRDLPAQRLRPGQGPAVQRDHHTGPGAPLYDPPNLVQDYQECVQPLPAGPATLLVPVSGGGTRPAVVWIPRGSLPAPDAISILNGGKAAAS